MTGTASDHASVVVGAAGRFAPTSYARLRLLRQLHASGLLAGARRRPSEPEEPEAMQTARRVRLESPNSASC